MYNIYGFLEYDLPENFSPPFKNADPLTKRTLKMAHLFIMALIPILKTRRSNSDTWSYC